MPHETVPASRRWLGFHIFLQTESAEADSNRVTGLTDRVLLELVKPLVRSSLADGSIHRYFFIRYSEMGPHLRLRLEVDSAVDGRLMSRLSPALALGPAREDELGAWFPSELDCIQQIRFVAYEPETQRYGGSDGVQIAEDLFFASSELVLELLHGVDDASTRSARTLLASVVLVHALSEGRDPRSLIEAHEEAVVRHLGQGRTADAAPASWRRYAEDRCERQPASLATAVRALWRSLERGHVPKPFDLSYERWVRARRQLEAAVEVGRLDDEGRPYRSGAEAIRHLIPSYLHMTSNRMGTDLLEEAFLAHLARRLLEPNQPEGVSQEPREPLSAQPFLQEQGTCRRGLQAEEQA